MPDDPIDVDRALIRIRLPEGVNLTDAVLPPAPDDEPVQLVPARELRLIVGALLQLLAKHRAQFDAFDPSGDLRHQYERFACAVRASGFRLDETQDRQARATEQRALGELAEAGGDLEAAVAWYTWALASWPAAGCKRRLQRLQRALAG